MDEKKCVKNIIKLPMTNEGKVDDLKTNMVGADNIRPN